MGEPCSAACHPTPHPILRTFSGSSACAKWPASSCSCGSCSVLPTLGIVTFSASSLPVGKARVLPRPIVCQMGSENSCFSWTGTFSESLTGRLLLPRAQCLKTREEGSQEPTSINENGEKTNQTMEQHFASSDGYHLITSPGPHLVIIRLQLITM